MNKIKEIMESENNLWLSWCITFLLEAAISIFDLGIVAKCIDVIVYIYMLVSAVLCFEKEY